MLLVGLCEWKITEMCILRTFEAEIVKIYFARKRIFSLSSKIRRSYTKEYVYMSVLFITLDNSVGCCQLGPISCCIIPENDFSQSQARLLS